jgi:hypothetical protein
MRNEPATVSGQIGLLWADFRITGEYAPVARMLDTLDQPDKLRDRIQKYLQSEKDAHNRQTFVKLLQELGLMRAGTVEELIPDDLELTLLLDAQGKVKKDHGDAFQQLSAFLKFSKDEWEQVLHLRRAASVSLQENVGKYPRLRELLTQHVAERPPKSQRLVKLWLGAQ